MKAGKKEEREEQKMQEGTNKCRLEGMEDAERKK